VSSPRRRPTRSTAPGSSGSSQARAETDGLTGLLNHRAAFEALDREIALAKKIAGTLSIIVVDLDDFKFFNDTHGHLSATVC
jgi:diguanylate cyclase (GGDEF)-like protein